MSDPRTPNELQGDLNLSVPEHSLMPNYSLIMLAE